MAASMANIVPRRKGATKSKTYIKEKYSLNLLSESPRQLLVTIFSSPWPDGCLCACSSSDCTTSTLLQKEYKEAPPLQVTKSLLILLDPHITCEDWAYE